MRIAIDLDDTIRDTSTNKPTKDAKKVIDGKQVQTKDFSHDFLSTIRRAFPQGSADYKILITNLTKYDYL